MGLIQRIIVWVLAAVLFLAFPWMIPPAIIYWAWQRGFLGRALRALRGWTKAIDLRGRISSLDAPLSEGMASHELRIRYKAPWEEAPFIVVEKEGEERVLAALVLRERAGNRSDFARVVAEAMALNSGLPWALAFSFFLSREGKVAALIAMERRVQASEGDLTAVEGDVKSRLGDLGRGLASVAPSLSVEVLRGRELAAHALWGVPN